MSLNTPQEEQAGLKLGFQIWQCFSFCSPTPQTIISERSQSKGCPAVLRERGENSHVTDWKVSPPSCLTMWYSPTNVLSWTTSEKKTDKITRSLSLFHIQLLVCRSMRELEARLQMLQMLTGHSLSASGSNGCRGGKGNLLQLLRNGHIFYLTAPLHIPSAYSRNCLLLPCVSSLCLSRHRFAWDLV